ncbi:MAG: triose-phosphate isomerase [Planctomycetia bacterium]|nr:triose-phosphate isomerase [Planctomycetia bacterium]
MTASTASRKKLVAGNWKMNLNRSQAIDLSAAIALRHAEAGSVELVLCPPSVYLDAVGSVLRLTGGQSPTGVSLGAQNMHEKASGAFTGEVAAAMLVDCSCHFVIVGHSERRTLFLETNAAVNAKTRAALAAGLTPIVCVGELLEEREAGHTEAIISQQVRDSLAGLSGADLGRIIVAYEPVWAIGTGKIATPQQAQEVHALIRQLLSSMASPLIASTVRIVYGGSVKPDNAATLAAQPDIDGALVGGASLKADDFLGIAAAFQ